MHSTNLLLEEPIRMVSILEPSKPVSYSPISPRFADLCVRAWIAEPSLVACPHPCSNGGQNFFPAMTKIVGTLGPKSRSVEAISACLKAGMSGSYHHPIRSRQRRFCFAY
jgi:pyruvate kinase